jgi:cell division protein FtsZ
MYEWRSAKTGGGMSESFHVDYNRAVFKVVGVGGAGLNAVNAMIDAGIDGVEYMAVNLSPARLRKSKAPVKILIGDDPRAFCTGGDPEVARQAAERHRQILAAHLRDTDMVFIAAGLGSGTGTGAAPVVARIARETGALVVAVVTRPFTLEGKKKMVKAQEGIVELRRHVDCLIVIPNDRLVELSGHGASLLDAFRPADDILLQAVQAIAELVNSHGHINADFNDVRAVMTERGLAMIGMGGARGENRATEAVTMAINSPLLEDGDIRGAKGILLNITGSSAMTMDEFDVITRIIHEKGDEDANIIIGMVIDEEMKDELKVTVIATGLRDPHGSGNVANARESQV